MGNRIYAQYQDLIEIIDNAKYTNNDPVSADTNVPTITIIDWDNVKTLDQIAIHNYAILKGFTVKSE